MVMDAEKVLQALKRRFVEPVSEFYQRRIIFWHDEEREFIDKIDAFELDGVKVVKVEVNERGEAANLFAVKKLLAMDDVESNYLVYCPVVLCDEENWLLNIELYSGDTFRADIYAIWMEEMGIGAQENLRSLIKKYRKFFKAKERRLSFAEVTGHAVQEKEIPLGIMASICGCGSLDPARIMRAVLMGGLDGAGNEIYKKFRMYELDELFWQTVGRCTGYMCEGEPSLSAFAAYLLLTASSRILPEACFDGLENDVSRPHAAFCYDIVFEWMTSGDLEKLKEISEYVEAEKGIYQRLMRAMDKTLNEDQHMMRRLMEASCFPCIHEALLVRLMTDISNDHIRPEMIKKIVEKRRTCVWYEPYACYYEALYQIAEMQGFYIEHSGGFHEASASKLWYQYTSDYYRMDTSYRLFQKAFMKSLKTTHAKFDDLMARVSECAEGLYSGWFLENLGESWQKASAGELAQNGRIENIPYQENFYNERVRKAGTRVFVLISDAFRYEVAAELAEQLRMEMQGEVQLSSMEGIFPTITSYGMAALLPHRKLTAVEKRNKLSVLADNMSTEAENRGDILRAANPSSIALRYCDIVRKKKSERSELVKGMDVVYIYHNRIDESSHASEHAVFSACDEAMEEIKNLLKIICSDFNGTRIFITADHGFLYTGHPLSEDSKVGRDGWNGFEIEYGRRYAIMRNGAVPEYLDPICFLGGKTDYTAFAPRGNIRIKMNGSGLNYVHGGASLQEMVVPLIDFHYFRAGTKAYQKNRDKIVTFPVKIGLLSTVRKIRNMNFSLDFYQKEKVGGNRVAAAYSLYFIDSSGKPVSDAKRFIADKTDEEPQKRVFRMNFHLKSMPFDHKAIYYLKIEDESGEQAPICEEFRIDVAFNGDEYDFFHN